MKTENKTKHAATAVLIVSCDKYHDAWRPFFTLFFKYWGDCPYPVYLGSNRRWYVDERVHPLLIGEDIDWSSNLRRMLERLIDYRHIIILQEDFFIHKYVDGAKVEKLISLMQERNAAYLRLFPSPGPSKITVPRLDVGDILPGEEYRVSLQATIWDREVLEKLLADGETPWQFEIRGSRRSDSIERPFLSVARNEKGDYPIQYLCTAIVRGRWLPEAIELLKKEGIILDAGKRPVMTPWFEYYDWLRSKLYILAKRLM